MLPPSAIGGNAFSAKRGTTMPPNLRDDQSEFSRDSTLKMGSSGDGKVMNKYHDDPEVHMYCKRLAAFCMSGIVSITFLAFLAMFVGGTVCFLNHSRLVNKVTTWADEGRITTASISVVPDGLGKRQMYSYGYFPTMNTTVSQASSLGSIVSATAPASRSVSTVTATATLSVSVVESTSGADVTVVNTATVVPVPAPVPMSTTGTTTTVAVTGQPSALSLGTPNTTIGMTAPPTASGFNFTGVPFWTTGTLNITSSITVQPGGPIHTESAGFSTFSIDAVTASMPQNSSISSMMTLSTATSTSLVLYNSTVLTITVTPSKTKIATLPSTSSVCDESESSSYTTVTETPQSTGTLQPTNTTSVTVTASVQTSESFYTTLTETLQPIDTTRVISTVPVQSPAVSASGGAATDTTLSGTTLTSTDTLAITLSNFITHTSTQTVVVSVTPGNCVPLPSSPVASVTATVVQTQTMTVSAGAAGFTAKGVSSPMGTTSETSTVTASMGQSSVETGMPSISISPNVTVTLVTSSGTEMSLRTSCNGTIVTTTTHIHTTAISNDAVTNSAPSSETLMAHTVSDVTVTWTSTFTATASGVFGSFYSGNSTGSMTAFHGTGTGISMSMVTISSTVYANAGDTPASMTSPAFSSGDKNLPPRLFGDPTPGGHTPPSGSTAGCVLMLSALILLLT